MKPKRLFVLFSIGATLLVPSITAQSPPPADSGLAPGAAAMRASINPETGEIEVGHAPVSSSRLDAYTTEALRRDATGLVEVHHPNGAVSVNLQGRFQSVAVARIGDDGKPHVTGCVDNPDAVQRARHADTTAEVK